MIMAKQATATSINTTTGKGWHGDPAGHAAAGRKGGMKSSGNFRNDPKRAAAAGRVGGRMSPGNFKNNPERARAAGRKGGSR
jgi:general stress protein YciG